MTGREFKVKLDNLGVKYSELAAKLEMSQQALSAAFIVKDVKTGFVERVASALDIPASSFYNDGVQTPTITVNAPNRNSAPVNAGNGTQMVTSDAKMMEAINTLIAQNAKKDEQIDRLLAILEKNK